LIGDNRVQCPGRLQKQRLEAIRKDRIADSLNHFPDGVEKSAVDGGLGRRPLLGGGACRERRRRGWRLVSDPQDNVVDDIPAQRFVDPGEQFRFEEQKLLQPNGVLRQKKKLAVSQRSRIGMAPDMLPYDFSPLLLEAKLLHPDFESMRFHE
jgi:hypothetical protein